MKLTFLGATLTVTGSKYLLELDEKKYLTDWGLFQGQKELRLRNRESFPIDPKTIEAIMLTHAHLDHSGYIPLLVKQWSYDSNQSTNRKPRYAIQSC